jgi:hypothetical protein
LHHVASAFAAAAFAAAAFAAAAFAAAAFAAAAFAADTPLHQSRRQTVHRVPERGTRLLLQVQGCENRD